ncbi:excalibur calcium-binding domain-containing protein [Streptomyces sp. NPDC014656]|uniref:excalibur calcium-binding domain-containing protein n=1 Tax=Streptomyces sp. NPDC014656 TaxID=3364878 RepID=UPI00370183BD
MHPQSNPYQSAPAWQPPRRWWQHPALIIVLLVLFPPAGIVLAWLGRWTNRTKTVATVLSALWFLLILVSDPQEDPAKGDDPKPAVTATATTPPAPEPTTESPSPAPTTESPTPEPTTQAPTTEAPTPTPTPTPEPTTRAPKPTTQAPKPKPVQTTQPPETAEPDPEPTEDAGSSVYYANCTAVRAAGAAPIHAGDPGYSRKLDRDGDGVACE